MSIRIFEGDIDIAGSANVTNSVSIAGSGDVIKLNNTGTKTILSNGGIVRLFINGVGEAFRVQANGDFIANKNVGIGTATPTKELEIIGSAYMSQLILKRGFANSYPALDHDPRIMATSNQNTFFPFDTNAGLGNLLIMARTTVPRSIIFCGRNAAGTGTEGKIQISTDGKLSIGKIQMNLNSPLCVTNLQTSSIGLTAGDVWSNGGVLTHV
ncbi:MAG: hypothetical protein E6R13_02615 [Spirochaetes bacterium]|nr:MAG: hypothetical protein E6R13_02615 [Spirochaetota bacterium]